MEYSITLVAELGFAQGVSSPCVFSHAERSIVLNVHGGDFIAAGSKRQLDWLEDAMRQHYELTTQPRLGPGAGDAKEGVILNRVIRWTEQGLEYEADPRQAEKLIAECGPGESNTVATPGVRLRSASLRMTSRSVQSSTPLSEELQPEPTISPQIEWTCSSRPRRSAGGWLLQPNSLGWP